MNRMTSVVIARPPRKRVMRNTQDEYRCTDCAGTGAIDIPHWNPQFDTWVACSGCEGTGWIRWRDYDPLVQLRGARRFGLTNRYHQLRQRAFAPVRLEH